jgi:hypothetical protein
MKAKVRNFPFKEVVARADALAKDGAVIFQKWTCAHCGSRQTMDKPNAFYVEGECEECHKVTDIQAAGCNYLLFWGNEKGFEALGKVTRVEAAKKEN